MTWLKALLLFVSLSNAAVTADLLIHFEGTHQGLLEVTNLSCITTSNKFWNAVYDEGKSTNFRRHFAVTNIFTNYLAVSVAGTNYGLGTNQLWVDTGTDLPAAELRVFVGNPFSGPTHPVGNMLAFGFVQYRMTNDTGRSRNIDSFLMNHGGGDWTVMQSRPMRGSDEVQIVAHSNLGALGTIHAKSGKTYFFEKLRDHTNGVVRIRFRDPDNGMAQVGSDISISFPRTMKYAAWGLHFRGGYLGLVPGGIVWDNVAVRFGATAFLTDSELGIVEQARD